MQPLELREAVSEVLFDLGLIGVLVVDSPMRLEVIVNGVSMEKEEQRWIVGSMVREERDCPIEEVSRCYVVPTTVPR